MVNEQISSPPKASCAVQLQLLDGGSFATGDASILEAESSGSIFRMYDWCFYIFHEPSGRHVLWDVGIGSNREDYTPFVLENQFPVAAPVGPRTSLVEQLKKIGVQPDEVETVIFSHAHWDHCRPIRNEFPNAKGLFGPGTRNFCSPGHLLYGKPSTEVQWDGRFFDPYGFATENWAELSGSWTRWGPFDEALDFFGDGSFWVIQAPGHMPGNLCAAAWVESEGEGHWVILASDCCHSRKLLDSEAKFARFTLPNGTDFCLHMDIEAAYNTLGKLKHTETELGARIALTHDAEWMKEGTDKVLMSLLSSDMRGGGVERVRRGEEP